MNAAQRERLDVALEILRLRTSDKELQEAAKVVVLEVLKG